MPAKDSPFLRACRREPVPYTPVWYMRQAGRSLPEYKRVRAGVPMLESCTRPDLITEITLQPVRRYPLDAAILFSDIVVPLKAIGVGVDIKPGVGPVLDHPVAVVGDLAPLRPLEPGDVPYTPVWFMRQAGRSLPEYKRVRAGVPMLESCTRPDLITEITLQPVRRYPVDAAVLFSDIVVPLKAIGIGIDIKPGVGPVLDHPVATAGDLAPLRPLEPGDVPYVSEAVATLVGELKDTPLIGFAGAPFTLASYLVEGGPSRHHDKTRALMYGQPDLWHALMSRLTAITTSFLEIQVAAGVAAVQLFDSWVGALAPADYRQFVLPHTTRIFQALAAHGVPRIHFGVGTGELLGLMREAGADVVGVDWRVPLDEAANRVGSGTALQGNLDPALLLAPWDVVAPRARDVLTRGRVAESHIFNLGHGVLPDTDPDQLARLTDFVHTESAR